MPPTTSALEDSTQVWDGGSSAPATFTYTAWRSVSSTASSRTTVQPGGGVNSETELPATTEATMTSPGCVPAGRSSVIAERASGAPFSAVPTGLIGPGWSGPGSGMVIGRG